MDNIGLKHCRIFYQCALVLLLTSLAGTMGGCAFFDLIKKDLTEFETNFCLTGKVHSQSPSDSPIAKVGVIIDLDDKFFSQENGSLGYWQPFFFIKKFGVGIYFLETYDPDKIPVLFVHGANGTPVVWKTIIAKLDRQRYQPWFFYYPSGCRLNSTAETLSLLVRKLHWEYRFDTFHIISHSMGGLVSRAFIVKNVGEEQQNYIKKFISISTPWGGVNMAALGVKKAPVVIPNWYDLSPDSEFLQYIYKDSLPQDVKFYLLFGVRGKCSMLMANNDDKVEIASEIDYRAQADATGFYGFDEDHESILTSDRVIDLLLELLEDSER